MLLLVITLATVLLPSLAQEYHYNRPQIPFQPGTVAYQPQQQQQQQQYQPQQQQQLQQQQHHHHQQQPQPQQQQAPATYVVHTLGPQSRAYELQMHKSQAIYVAHQLGGLQGNQLTFTAPPQQQQLYQPPQQQQQQLYQPPQQQLYQPPQQLQQLLPATSHANPLTANYQQLTPASASYYAAPQSAVATATTSATASSTVSSSSSAQPYALVQLPSGQRVQDGGHGSGVAQTQSQSQSQSQAVAPRVGDYYAQSQASQLDFHGYKQTTPGDVRNYQRYIMSCQPNGQCQRVILAAGQQEPGHQQVLQSARAQTQPAQNKCAQTAAAAYAGGSYHRGGAAAALPYVPPGAELTTDGQLRPRNRRTYQYSESTLPRYPYN